MLALPALHLVEKGHTRSDRIWALHAVFMLTNWQLGMALGAMWPCADCGHRKDKHKQGCTWG